jgi:general secretion pathway protein F
MSAFRYTAIDAAGAMRQGVMDAPDEATLIERLRREGLMPVRAMRAGGGLGHLLRFEIGGGQALSKSDVALFTRELATMLSAGQDLDRALRFLAETAPSARMRGIVEKIRDVVRNGGTLAAALADHPKSFPRLYLGMVRAGEAGGALGPTLERLATLLERERSMAATVTSAMVYPVLLVVAAVGSIAFLLTGVLPQFIPLFEQNGVQPPRATRILMSIGSFVSDDGLFVLIALAALFLAARAALRRPAIRLVADRILLRIPIVGGLARDALAARFTRTLGTLLLNGVPLIAALGIVRDVIGNLAATAVLERATLVAQGGGGLAAPLAEGGVLPVRTIHLLRLGEETARLGDMALRAAEIHEERTRAGVQRLVSLLVPVITIVMGAAVAGIVSSLLLAMLSLNDLAN